MRHDEPHRMHDMRRVAQQDFAFGKRFGNEAKFELFEITQPAVDQLAARRTGGRAKVVFFAEDLRPRPAASRAMPAPLIPPPTTSRSISAEGPALIENFPFQPPKTNEAALGRLVMP